MISLDRSRPRQHCARAKRGCRQRWTVSTSASSKAIVRASLLAVNDRACQILGYRREQLLRMTVHELTAPQDQALSDELNAQLHAGSRPSLDYEKRYRRGDGSPLWARETVSAVRDPAGRLLRYIGTIEDISERKQWEQQLQDLNKTLEGRVAERTAQAEELRRATGPAGWGIGTGRATGAAAAGPGAARPSATIAGRDADKSQRVDAAAEPTRGSAMSPNRWTSCLANRSPHHGH